MNHVPEIRARVSQLSPYTFENTEYNLVCNNQKLTRTVEVVKF